MVERRFASLRGLMLAAVLFAPLPAAAQSAHLWVDTDGGSCTRSGSQAGYNSSAACGSFAAATAAAASGDTIRVKAGTYGPQGSIGSSSKTVTFIGEDGAVIDGGSNSGTYNHLNFSGNVTVDNVDVAGDYPLVLFFGQNNTWRRSTFKTGRQIRRCNSDEPIVIQTDNDDPAKAIKNTTLQDIVIETQRASVAGQGGCPSNDPFHLELIRIGRNVDGVLMDRVTFGACPNGSGYVGCGSGQVFLTTTGGGVPPRNITIRNSRFFGTVNYHIQTHANIGTGNVNWTFAYNTFGSNEPIALGAAHRSITFVGNVGTRPPTCHSGVTYTKNVWQWWAGSGTCGTDKAVGGDGYSTNRLGFDSNLRLTSGSPAIDAGEASCSSTSTGIDRDGDFRPFGSACDAGADEFGATGGGGAVPPPSTPQNLQIITTSARLERERFLPLGTARHAG